MIKIKWILFFFLLTVLLYSRLINLSWGLPYPMHPDERNMANAIQQLQCPIQSSEFRIQNCFNPHFFAYGQFPLYLGYGIVMILKFFDGDLGMPISFEEAVLSLRVISAIASIINVIILLKLVQLIISNFPASPAGRQFPISKKISINNYQLTIAFLAFTFSPFFIQFSHFGTTESLLMLLFSVVLYLSLLFTKGNLLSSNFYLLTSIFSGIAIATKVSSVLFLIVPIALIIDQTRMTISARSISIWYLLTLTLVFSILFSPHNFISFPQFLGSMKYEADVAFGIYRAFYTRQFEGTFPVIFQFVKIFPYVLGWPTFIFFLLGFIFLPYKIEFNLVRLAILVGFLPSAFFYAKWTRFVSPIFPLMLVVAIAYLNVILNLFQDLVGHSRGSGNPELNRFRIKSGMTKTLIFFSFLLLTFTFILPGIGYLSIYQNPDVRFTASEWIYRNIPDKSYILFETANVVDIPIQSQKAKVKSQNYQMISFNFYDLDENPVLQSQLREHVAKADYIFIPSRRIFANHYCVPLPSFRGSETTEKSKSNVTSDRILRFARFLATARNDT